MLSTDKRRKFFGLIKTETVTQTTEDTLSVTTIKYVLGIEVSRHSYTRPLGMGDQLRKAFLGYTF